MNALAITSIIKDNNFSKGCVIVLRGEIEEQYSTVITNLSIFHLDQTADPFKEYVQALNSQSPKNFMIIIGTSQYSEVSNPIWDFAIDEPSKQCNTTIFYDLQLDVDSGCGLGDLFDRSLDYAFIFGSESKEYINGTWDYFYSIMQDDDLSEEEHIEKDWKLILRAMQPQQALFLNNHIKYLSQVTPYEFKALNEDSSSILSNATPWKKRTRR